jgi:hypothetical protein
LVKNILLQSFALQFPWIKSRGSNILSLPPYLACIIKSFPHKTRGFQTGKNQTFLKITICCRTWSWIKQLKIYLFVNTMGSPKNCFLFLPHWCFWCCTWSCRPWSIWGVGIALNSTEPHSKVGLESCPTIECKKKLVLKF